MLFNELICLPTDETLDHLSRVFSACPFDLDLKKLYVVLDQSERPLKPDTSRVYEAKAGTLNLWYDTAVQMSSLILPLESEAMRERAMELRDGKGSTFYGDHYFPHMVILQDAPPMSRHYRTFISSVSTTLATSDYPLYFDAELVVQRDYHAIPQADFYAAMLANHYRN